MRTISILILTIISLSLSAQNNKTANFIGINPSVTVEPFYEKGELDVNIFPLVFQKTITKRVDFRLSTILNYGVRNTNSEISHFGARIAFPFFIKKKEDLTLPSKGFYAAPGIGFTRNRIEEHTNIGFWLEPGYNLLVSDKLSISFGVQLGATHFDYDNGTQKWGNHFGMNIILGMWY